MSDTAYDPVARGTDRFDAIECLLARYPDIDGSEQAQLELWFRREASAFEIASMASKDTVAEGYPRFRADHIDRFKPVELVAIFVICTLALCGLIAALEIGA